MLVRSCVPKIILQSPATSITSTPSIKDIPPFRQGHFAPAPIDFGQAGGNAGKISVRTGGGWSQQNEYSVLVIFTREAPWQKEPKFSLCPLCRGKSSAAQKKTSRLIHQPGVNTLKGSVSLHAWTAASVSVDCDVQSVHFRSDRLFS